jgi:prepilin-type N-terminal cleavage/methylation domain-containing protein
MGKKSLKKGFTLIELLVSITILAILSVLALSSFTAVQKKGRDSRRRADLKAIQNSFEQYYAASNTYHSNCSSMAGYLQGGLITTGPKGDTYSTACATAGYCVCASLEAGGGNSSNASCNFGSTGNYFCVTNLQ